MNKKNVDVQVSELPEVIGIPSLVQQLFYNLINNALKFSRENVQPKITISAGIVHTDDLPMGYSKNGIAKYSDIRIQDNGIGFNQKYAETLFNILSGLKRKKLKINESCRSLNFPVKPGKIKIVYALKLYHLWIGDFGGHYLVNISIQ